MSPNWEMWTPPPLKDLPDIDENSRRFIAWDPARGPDMACRAEFIAFTDGTLLLLDVEYSEVL